MFKLEKKLRNKKGMADAIIYLMVLLLLVLIIVLFFFIFKWRHEVIYNRISENIEKNDMSFILLSYLRTPINVDANGAAKEYFIGDLLNYRCNENNPEYLIKSSSHSTDTIEAELIRKTQEIFSSLPYKKNWKLSCTYLLAENVESSIAEAAEKEKEYSTYAYTLIPLSDINLYKGNYLLAELRLYDEYEDPAEYDTAEIFDESKENENQATQAIA